MVKTTAQNVQSIQSPENQLISSLNQENQLISNSKSEKYTVSSLPPQNQLVSGSKSEDIVLIFGGSNDITKITQSNIMKIENRCFNLEKKVRVAPAWQKDKQTGDIKLSDINELNLGKIKPEHIKHVVIDLGSFPIQANFNLYAKNENSTISPFKLHEFYSKCEDGTRLIHDWFLSMKKRFFNLQSFVEISDDESCLPLKTVLYVIAQDDSLNLKLLPQTNSKKFHEVYKTGVSWFLNKVQNACFYIEDNQEVETTNSDKSESSQFFGKQSSISIQVENKVIDFDED